MTSSIVSLTAISMYAAALFSFTGGSFEKHNLKSKMPSVFIVQDQTEHCSDTGKSVYIVNEEFDNRIKVKIEKQWSDGVGGITDSKISSMILNPGQRKHIGCTDNQMGSQKGYTYFKLISYEVIKE